jgi:hypothetical protein
MRFLGSTHFAVKVLGNLLERSVAGLDVEEVHDNKLDHNPDVVHDVVLPSDVLQSDGVDVLVANWDVSKSLTQRRYVGLTRTEQCPP